ncbi:MAG: 2-C-methyl-D-erythritol 4-phosphate cytidylyltransferase [Thermodesulfobacteriota bacterium]|nr:2-C-methyl-D-erythritol 4-phosphate cytidylyltransferase [Thermodesulfobacteriota bacterium]
MSAWAVILAAGQGSRLAEAGIPEKKQFYAYQGRPLYWHSAKALAKTPALGGLVFVFPPDELSRFEAKTRELFASENLNIPWTVAPGGDRRQDSAYSGLLALPRECAVALVHDAARPFVTARLASRLIDAVSQGAKAVIPAIPLRDTIKKVADGSVVSTLERSGLRAVQTPQVFVKDALITAHEAARAGNWTVTDDAALLERVGEPVAVITGDPGNVKITTPEDLALLDKGVDPTEVCVGFGFDVHRFGPGRPMKLGGIPITNGPEIEAHSDGDVLLHALIDALLGCMARGDIGDHFPDTDPAYEGIESGILLSETLALAQRSGLVISHVDLTVIAQIPKIAPWRDQIRKNVAGLLGLLPGRVNVKATTEEGLGFTGEKKGIKAVACVTALKRR